MNEVVIIAGSTPVGARRAGRLDTTRKVLAMSNAVCFTHDDGPAALTAWTMLEEDGDLTLGVTTANGVEHEIGYIRAIDGVLVLLDLADDIGLLIDDCTHAITVEYT